MQTIDPYYTGRMKAIDLRHDEMPLVKIGKAKRETKDGRYLIVYK